jgi:hypothetical protein
MPDQVIAAYDPEVIALASAEITDTNILAYLRAVRRARLHTIAQRMRLALKPAERRLYRLVESEALNVSDDTFSLSPRCRDVLREIVTVEVKVGHWRRAVEQAVRNRIFAHRSFVALPVEVAQRVRGEEMFQRSGVGLLSISARGEVGVLQGARRGRPRVWSYYYRLAALVGRTPLISDAIHARPR